MPIPRPIGLVLLSYLLFILPWMSYRSARHLRAMRAGATTIDGQPVPTRTRIFTGTLFLMVMLFLLAWIAGMVYRYAPFWYQSIGMREIGLGVVAFAAFLGLRQVNRAIRTPEERRTMAVRQLLPHSGPEWRLYFVLGLAAGITEEYAYRGVGMYALSQWIGNPWIAAGVMALAFGLAHITQEWKSAGIISAMAVVMHALVALTNTLVVAMVVHTVYDWVAAFLLRRDMRMEAAAAPSPQRGDIYR